MTVFRSLPGSVLHPRKKADAVDLAPSSWRLSTRKGLLASTGKRQDYTFRDHFYSFWLGNAFQKCWVSQITMSDTVALWAWIRHNVRYLSHALSLMSVPFLLWRAGGELTFSEWFRKQLWKKKAFLCCSHCRDLFQRLHFLSHVKMRLLTSQRTRRLLRQVRITAVGSKTTPLTPYLSNISIQHVQLKRAPAVL